ncbi:ATP-binding cassette domain-containing protein [Mesoflavibacter zeaxanthinifaciens]|uniref:ATP-binding cassette domain-containing protein n=1 Tax=Mesoflavibacter zeaxanthinifaciens TaxID=393060 RepID=UPI0003F60314|nr:ATP-binding cassette domain-containing protein [Mesoflavibacter zeaxanthinifaciens]
MAQIKLNNIKPKYMSEAEISTSDIYLKENIVFEQGKNYLIKANSGHGKSSLLNFIYKSNINYTGEITYPFSDNSITNIRQNKISYVFQDLKLFPSLTVLENIQLKNTITNYKTDEQILGLIQKLQLSHKTHSLVETLSLGQQQRVAIIRALCQPFEYMLLDEPFSHLDNTNIKIITELLLDELHQRKAGMIITALEDLTMVKFDKIIHL